MDTFELRSLCVWVVVITLVYSSHPFEQDRDKVEQLYKETHPNLSYIDLLKWDLADNITNEKVEKACLDVARAVNASDHVVTYLPSTTNSSEDRVITYAPILFLAGAIRLIKYATLVNCTFAEMKFYLARGSDDNHAFRLIKDDVNYIFYFRSGVHKISYSGGGR